jgi:hypothetical protein
MLQSNKRPERARESRPRNHTKIHMLRDHTAYGSIDTRSRDDVVPKAVGWIDNMSLFPSLRKIHPGKDINDEDGSLKLG